MTEEQRDNGSDLLDKVYRLLRECGLLRHHLVGEHREKFALSINQARCALMDAQSAFEQSD